MGLLNLFKRKNKNTLQSETEEKDPNELSDLMKCYS